ncbi:DUF3397 family protein [Streptococcus moroccensis]|uniref:Neutral ceramidase superfamily lipid hydrolase n=1 Tax=Streptococcus moroccensis TaxID=1451356 RepID=A0ABT9YNK2_9STRE|nr:DUF3397 family protein [Streptococcus moroccensis]MDQ0221574.1 putative neutral ceramidase superfamily lipid hydrolase [Streptococcus moroccensis]
MLFLKIVSVLFLFLGLPLAMAVTGLFRLRHFNIGVPDVALPLYAIALYIVSARTFYHSLLALYVLLLALLLLGIIIYYFIKKRTVPIKRAFKIFWRLSFLLTLIFYLALVIYILIFVA